MRGSALQKEQRMTAQRTNSRILPSAYRVFLFIAVAWMGASMAAPASAVDQNTAFLPFQIIAQTVDESLTASVDDNLTNVLLLNNFKMMDRDQAEELVDYNKWPPDTAALDSIAKATGLDSVAAGSVTIIGSQISIDVKVYDVLNPENPRYFVKES